VVMVLAVLNYVKSLSTRQAAWLFCVVFLLLLPMCAGAVLGLLLCIWMLAGLFYLCAEPVWSGAPMPLPLLDRALLVLLAAAVFFLLWQHKSKAQ
jgi:hypothetical protein